MGERSTSGAGASTGFEPAACAAPAGFPGADVAAEAAGIARRGIAADDAVGLSAPLGGDETGAEAGAAGAKSAPCGIAVRVGPCRGTGATAGRPAAPPRSTRDAVNGASYPVCRSIARYRSSSPAAA